MLYNVFNNGGERLLLKDIADIRVGLVITRKKAQLSSQIKAKYKLITLKNIEVDGLFNNEEYEEFYSTEILNDEYLTEEGDILMRMSEPHTVVYIDKSKQGLLVPSYFAIIKVTDSNFLPQYVAWYLNSSKIKKEIKRNLSGGTVLFINIRNIAELKIKHIPIEKQEAIIKINTLKNQELQLLNKLIEKKEKLYDIICENIIN